MKIERRKASDSLLKKPNPDRGKKSSAKVSNVEETESSVNIQHSTFFDALSSVEDIKTQDELIKIYNEIEEAGEIFKNVPTFSHLKRYKALIQQFMAKVVKDAYKVNSTISKRIDREDKILTTVKKVDKKLEELAEELLNKQIDNIKLAAKVDEIKGLLMDLVY